MLDKLIKIYSFFIFNKLYTQKRITEKKILAIPRVFKSYAVQLGFPESKNIFRIFEIIYEDEDDIKILKALSRPRFLDVIVRKTELPKKRVEERLKILVRRGAIDIRKEGTYRRFPVFIELRDATCLWPDAPQELFELWEDLLHNELPKVVPIIKKLKINPLVRVIPIERSVGVQNTVLDADSVRKIFQDADLITAMPCVCRRIARKNGRGQNCPAPKEAVCMQTNQFAKAVLERGLGEKISNEEALRRLRLAEEAGLVQMVRNNIKKDMFVCNCCSCCCAGFFMVHKVGYFGGMAPSRFAVKLDEEICIGCGTCEERCQFQAITMDEKPEINLDRCFWMWKLCYNMF